MPEGHLIHHLAEAHARELAGATTRASSPQGRFARQAAMLDGRTLDEVKPFGKHLFYRWGNDVVHVHLGKQGLFLEFPTPGPPPRAGVRLRLEGEHTTIDLIAPRVCELGTREMCEEIVSRLGPDPLRQESVGADVVDAMVGTSRPIGAVLLDQSVVSGVGNVLRAEVLSVARIHPSTPANRLTRDALARLWEELVTLMRRSKELGRIRTIDADAELSDADTRFVYKQERCRRCGTRVEVAQIGGRTSYACPRCQPALGTGQT